MVAALYAKLTWTLLASFCAMGLCLTFAQPLFSVPDEPAHWQAAHVRIETLLGSEACVRTLQGGRCPKRTRCSALPPMELHCAPAPDIYGGVFTYPGVLLAKLVLPRQTESATRQAQGMVLARLLQGLLVLLCLARAGGQVVGSRRVGALALGAFAVSPLVAQQSFAISSDSAQLAFGACLFTAIVAWDRLGWLDLALFSLFGFCATAKPTVLLCIVPSVVAAQLFASLADDPRASMREMLSRLWRELGAVRHPSVQTALLWSALLLSALTIFLSVHHDASSTAVVPPTAARLANGAALRDHPLLALELATRMRYTPLSAEHWVSPLGWLDAYVARAVTNGFLRLMIAMLALELGVLGARVWLQRRAKLGPWRPALRALFPLALGCAGPLSTVVFLSALMFVFWAPAGSTTPEGMQMRYLFPAIMVLIALLFRTLDLLIPAPAACAPAACTPAANTAASWKARLLSIALIALTLSLSLPLVARVFVDLALRYHDPMR